MPRRSSLGVDLSAAPCFARTRRGSTPFSFAPNNRLGSGRHSIRMFRLIVQSDFRYFYRQEIHVDQQVVNMEVAHIHSLSAAAEEVRPESKVGLDALIAIKLDAPRRFSLTRECTQRGKSCFAPNHI